MRDTNRIEPFLLELAKLWQEKFPDWRFGQLMYNFFSVLGDPFYYEEDEFLEAFRAYCERRDPKAGVKDLRERKRAERERERQAQTASDSSDGGKEAEIAKSFMEQIEKLRQAMREEQKAQSDTDK